MIASACVICAPVCGAACCSGLVLLISGLFVGIFGVGVSMFLHKFNLIFIVFGVILFGVGIVLMIQRKRFKGILTDPCAQDCKVSSNCCEPPSSGKSQNEKNGGK